MEPPREALAAFIREHQREILEIWDEAARQVNGASGLPHTVIRDRMEGVLENIAAEIEQARATSADRCELRRSLAIGEHVLQRAEIGVTLASIVEETLALRDAIERACEAAGARESTEQLLALRRAVERVLLATTERFVQLRTSLLDAIDEVLRRYPGESLENTLQDVLRSIRKHVDGIDTAAVLLREDGRLRVRAAIGLEEEVEIGFSVRVGQGFAGTIAIEQKPRLIRAAATDPLIANVVIQRSGLRALYGVPLIHGNELLGVAHMGSKSADDFSDEAKGLFRVIMQRAAGILSQAILLDRVELERAKYRAVTDNAPTFIFAKDLDGRYLNVNRRAIAELGLGPDQLLGRTDFDVFPPEIAEKLRENDRRVMGSQTTVQLEEIMLRAGREPRTYLSVKFPIVDSSGRLSAVGGVSTDITERKRRLLGQQLLADVGRLIASTQREQETLAAIARRSTPLLADCSIVELVASGDVRRALVHHQDPSKADLARALLVFPLDRDRPHLAQVTFVNREPVYVPAIPADYLDSVSQSPEHRRLLRELDPTSMIQIPLLARGHFYGVWMFLRCGSGAPYDDLDQTFASELGSLVSLAIDNARLYETAQRATRAREEILGVVAHDLRSPLGAVGMAGALLAESLPAEAGAARRHVDAVLRGVDQMTRLVSDLLDQHAIESGKLSVTALPYAASALVREAADVQRGRIERAKLSLDIAVPDTLPAVLADKDRIQQVFANLVTNACKFTPAGGRVTLGAEEAQTDIRFFVSDTGPGIPPEELPRLYDRFWRGRPADRRGLGLGLPICKAIIEAHGGRIWVTSTEGQGTTVCFTLRRPRSREGRAIGQHEGR